MAALLGFGGLVLAIFGLGLILENKRYGLILYLLGAAGFCGGLYLSPSPF